LRSVEVAQVQEVLKDLILPEDFHRRTRRAST
jgi:hypothetical protein